MITKRTVFVLGAGASKPYGFPTGPELAEMVTTEIEASFQLGDRPGEVLFVNTPFNRILLNAFSFAGITVELLQAFPLAFRASACGSLDEFVQPQGNRRFLPLVKAATIVQLLKFEQEERLSPRDPANAGDWYEYLFRFLRTDDPANFADNKVKIITFNFDRSFERRLFLLLRGYYGISDTEASVLRSKIQVLHLHGSLGGEHWCGERRPESRPYDQEASSRQMADLFNAIRIVHEEIDPRELARAHDWLQDAHTICFLGFGYHRLTMGRLDIATPMPEVTIWGTAIGFSGPELDRVLARFGDNHAKRRVHLDTTCSMDCRRYLRETGVLQTD